MSRGFKSELVDALNDKNIVVRNLAAMALSISDPRVAKQHAVPKVVRDLKNGDVKIQREAAITLGEMGKVAEAAVPDLIQAIHKARSRKKDKYIEQNATALLFLRSEAAEALGKIGPGAKRSIPLLIEEMKDDPIAEKQLGRSDVYLFAGDALIQMGEPAVPALVSALGEDDYTLRQRIVEVLGEIGAPARSATMALQHLLMRDDVLLDPAKRELCDKIVDALGQIDPVFQKEAVAQMESVESKYAAETFANFIAKLDLDKGSEKLTADYVTSYIRALENKDPTIRQKAAQALGKIGPTAGEAALSLAWTLFDNNRVVCEESAKALRLIGAKANQAAPYLVQALSSPFESVRLESAKALAQIGSIEDKDIVQMFWATNDKDPRVRKTLKDTLTKIGMEQPEAFQRAVAMIREK